jgi:hypothetical protein
MVRHVHVCLVPNQHTAKVQMAFVSAVHQRRPIPVRGVHHAKKLVNKDVNFCVYISCASAVTRQSRESERCSTHIRLSIRLTHVGSAAM